MIASNVSADEWERVVSGLAALRLFLSVDTFPFKRAEAGLLVPLGPNLKGLVQRTHRAAARAYAALAPLAGIG